MLPWDRNKTLTCLAGAEPVAGAHQYLGSVGKIENGIVAVTTLWADERVYYPLHAVPYTPAGRLPGGRSDPDFRTKPRLAAALAGRAQAAGVPFRALVADCAYGDNAAFTAELWAAGLPFVLALKPHQGSWASVDEAHTPIGAARELSWEGPGHRAPGPRSCGAFAMAAAVCGGPRTRPWSAAG
ncbi:transposase [Streptosporangium sp. NPDC087985]|uniref:transposase n=1 Tax=Streptosporangium sp. NPDC087985 TaxID=3366196 RepID=UPI003809934A